MEGFVVYTFDKDGQFDAAREEMNGWINDGKMVTFLQKSFFNRNHPLSIWL